MMRWPRYDPSVSVSEFCDYTHQTSIMINFPYFPCDKSSRGFQLPKKTSCVTFHSPCGWPETLLIEWQSHPMDKWVGSARTWIWGVASYASSWWSSQTVVGQERRLETAQGQESDRSDAEEYHWPTLAYHSTEYAASTVNIIKLYTLPNWDVNPECELYMVWGVMGTHSSCGRCTPIACWIGYCWTHAYCCK